VREVKCLTYNTIYIYSALIPFFQFLFDKKLKTAFSLSACEPAHQARGVPTPATHRLNLGIIAVNNASYR
jgi:hypothetical protein